MCKLLVSVKSQPEALLAYENGVDYIDLKNPATGALGALDLNTTKQVINDLNGKAIISATTGDLPMDAEKIREAIAQRQHLGIDYLKVGFFPAKEQDYLGCIEVLSQYAEQGVNLIVVLFADYEYPHDLISQLCQSGIKGLMLDTSNKDGRTLADYYSDVQLQQFCKQVAAAELMLGLAGSLQQTDVEGLQKYKPDYLGFRGGVCFSSDRNAALDPIKISQISKIM